MSTVSKKIADAVIAGKYPEDNIKAILLYHNQFNGADAYKLIYGSMSVINTALFIASDFVKLYWINESMYSVEEIETLKTFLEKEEDEPTGNS